MKGKEDNRSPVAEANHSAAGPATEQKRHPLPAQSTDKGFDPEPINDLQDCKEMLQQQQEYIQQLEQERDLFASGPVLTITWDPVSRGAINQISPNVSDILGYQAEEITRPGFIYDDIIHPEDREVQRNESSKNQKKGLNHYNQHYRLRTKAGDYRWFYDQTQCIRDVQGNVVGYKGYLMDETPLLESQQALAEERRRLADIIEATQAGTWEWNVQTGQMMINHLWAGIIGYTMEELEPISIDTWRAHAHPEDRKASDALLQEVFCGQRNFYEFDCRMKHKQGHWVWVLDRGRLVSRTKDGKPEWMSGTHTDITQRKEAEKKLLELNQLLEQKNLALDEAVNRATAANEAKSRYLAHINHEMRTPLNGLMGFMQLMEMTQMDGEQGDYMNNMKLAANHLLSIINNVLDHAQIEAGEMQLTHQPFMLKDEIHSALAPLQSLAWRQHLTIELTLNQNLPQKVVGDAQRLRQIILNLVGNAIKYTPEGQIRIDFSSVETKGQHHVLKMVVEDTGLGMSEKRLENLFQPFYQTNDDSATRPRGAGLGLVITKELVELMDGEILVESTQGKGTRVEVQIRLMKI